MPGEGYVQVSPDSTGKRIRTLEITTQNNDGSTQTAEMQVIAISDLQGNLLDVNWTQRLENLEERVATTNALLAIVAAAILGKRHQPQELLAMAGDKTWM